MGWNVGCDHNSSYPQKTFRLSTERAFTSKNGTIYTDIVVRKVAVVLSSLLVLLAAASSFVSKPSDIKAQAGGRNLKYYAVDRVRDNTDFAKLAAWGINTAVVNLFTGGSTSEWQSVYDAANAAGIKIVVWPNIGSDNACGWESPFNDPTGGSYIESVKPLLDFWKDKAIGIVTAHEPMWHICNDKWKDMKATNEQIRAYTGGL